MGSQDGSPVRGYSVGIDHLRTVDRERLVAYIDALSEQTLASVLRR
jgi:hypothetical protein